MPLGTYAQARPWAQAIKEEILARRMPPWPAERGFGVFSNDAALTPREFEFLISWIDGGVPEGTGNVPPYVDHGGHWTLGAPDLMLKPRAATVVEPRSAPAMKRLVVDTGLTRDAWVRGIDFEPGDARVVRAAFFTVEGTDRYLGGWTPSQAAAALPRDVGFSLPARARIAIDVLYSGTTARVDDTPTLGLYLAASPPPKRLTTSVLRPGTAMTVDRPVVAELRIAQNRSLESLRPVMQDGARSLEVKLLRPDGSRAVLLWIKEVRQDWPVPYVFKDPVTIPAGSRLQATAYFDRAPANRSMPPFAVSVNHYENVGTR